VAILGVAMALVTTGMVSVAIGFFGAAVAVLALQLLTLKEAYEAIEWPVLILFGALIPVSEALQATGATGLVAGWLSVAAQHLPVLGALGMMLVAAMALTPFLNNAAAGMAGKLALSPDPFLMAVAIGAGCDFLTPIGHQCNTLVMGPGGYRFGDYWRLGLPLSVMVAILGTFLISIFWPLR
jgi:di/tricarboxylate transporter